MESTKNSFKNFFRDKKSPNKTIEELHKAKQKMLKERDRLKQEKIALIKVVNSQKSGSGAISPRASLISNNSFIKVQEFDIESENGKSEYINDKMIFDNNIRITDINSDIDLSQKNLDFNDATSVSASELSGDEGTSPFNLNISNILLII